VLFRGVQSFEASRRLSFFLLSSSFSGFLFLFLLADFSLKLPLVKNRLPHI